MSKNEFLDILRQSLAGEVDPGIIDQNIKYYEQYIGTHSSEEENNILKTLGDPRLIAKTIIESERIVKQKGKFTGRQSYQDNNGREEESDENQNRGRNGNQTFFTNFKWYHKVMLGFIFLIIFMLIVFVGRILIAFGLPIIIILLLFSLLKRR